MESWRGYYHSDEDWLMPSPLQVSIIPLNLARYSCVNKTFGIKLDTKFLFFLSNVKKRFVTHPQSILVDLIDTG